MKKKLGFIVIFIAALIIFIYWLFSQNGSDELSRGRFFVEEGILFKDEVLENCRDTSDHYLELSGNTIQFKNPLELFRSNSQAKTCVTSTIFRPQGFVYSPYYPGETGGEDLPNDERYFNHLQEIKSLGLNSLSIFPQKMPTKFFSALEENDLFYAQIININLYDGTDNSNLLSEAYQEKVKAHIFSIIDYNYLVGNPERLIYFALGYEINPYYITNTNRLNKGERSFSGKFISLKNREPAEIALAKLLDSAISYELEKYGRISLYTHVGFSAYEEVNFRPYFFDLLAINLYPSYYYDPEDAFLEERFSGLETSLKPLESSEASAPSASFSPYLSSLLKFNKPLIISELGLPTIFTPNKPGVPPYGENREEDLVKFYERVARDIQEAKKDRKDKKDNLVGLFIFEFMDEWWKNGEEERDAYFHNPEDQEEWFGLYSVEVSELGAYYLMPKTKILEAVLDLFKVF